MKMELNEFLISAEEFGQRTGPHDAIVLSSRVRLARNIVGIPFPGRADRESKQRVLETVQPAVESLPEMKSHFSGAMADLKAVEKQILMERHLISREHAAKGAGSGIVLNRDETLCVMVNEEDHLRIQSIRPGLQLKQVWQRIDKFDSELEAKIGYAFSDKLGYLTACPTNLGTGIRVSAMLHLPGLVLNEQVNQIIQAVNKLGHTVRGFYGEGTEALGHIFQVSNQMTLGETEAEIVERINKVVLQIVEHEATARRTLLEKKPNELFNHVGRALGVTAHAHIISSKEAMNLLSLLRLGISMNLMPGLERSSLDELFLLIQPAHLQQTCGEKLASEQRDLVRAGLLRKRMKGVKGVKPPPEPSDA